MVDCGEGTQVQLRRLHIHFNRISSILITHLHGDHCFGVIGVISTFGMLGRTAPLNIYAPPEFESILKLEMDFFCKGLEYKVFFHGIDTKVSQVVYEDKSVAITTIPLNHKIPCCGYKFCEKPALPHIRRDMMDYYQIPECYRNNIKNGADWTTPDGKVIPNRYLTEPADNPRTYAYCSDTKYMDNLYESVKGVDLLYHEATYCDKDKNRAALYYHSTASQAALVAKNACVKKLIIGHYSARYENEDILLEEASRIFTNTALTHEKDIFDV